MGIPEKAILLRIFIGEDDKYNGKPLYEHIVLEAKKRKLSGATVIRGVMGFGAKSHLHTAKLLRISDDLPMVIEIVDSEEKIKEFLKYLDDVVHEGLITLEKVNVIRYCPKKRK